MDVFRTESPIVGNIFSTNSISVLGKGTYAGMIRSISFFPFSLAGNGAFPAKHTKAETFYWHDPNAADNILTLVYVFRVDTLPVENTYLIMEQVAARGIGKNIAL